MALHSYSVIERAIHRMVFGSTLLQNILEDIERTYYGGTWRDVAISKPVFITSLPRAGTTILLQSLYKIPGMASYSYRDMPFISTPLLWDRVSKPVRVKTRKSERAHGDGIRIDIQSPEAFDEVFWQRYFPNHYTNDGITLWHEGATGFAEYFREQMMKIIALRAGTSTKNGRYLSKNNANIARIAFLKTLFPDAFVLVSLRHPIEHAISMWLQHNNFLKKHAQSGFSRRYMADIGHYEFGALHRPIMFPLLNMLTEGLTPSDLDYWLGYWVAAFDHLSRQDGIDFVCYEALCSSGVEGMSDLVRHVEIEATTKAIDDAAATLHSPPPPRRHKYSVNERLVERAMSLYVNLTPRCLLS